VIERGISSKSPAYSIADVVMATDLVQELGEDTRAQSMKTLDVTLSPQALRDWRAVGRCGRGPVLLPSDMILDLGGLAGLAGVGFVLRHWLKRPTLDGALPRKLLSTRRFLPRPRRCAGDQARSASETCSLQPCGESDGGHKVCS